MSKAETYDKKTLFQWILLLPLSFCVLVFSGYISTSEACEPQPEQIELVVASQDQTVENVLSYHTLIALEYAIPHVNKSKTYEADLRLNQQRSVKISFETVLKRSYTFIPPVFYHYETIIPHSNEDSSPFSSGMIIA